ncbi:MAG: STAS domain-containing protein [Gemmatimonadota bacterium]
MLIMKGPLDPTAVDHLRRYVCALPDSATRARILCGKVSGLDPVGVAALWRLCVEARQRGIELLLEGLPERMARSLRRHPIMEFFGVEEEIFGNPLATLAASDR